MSNVLHDTPAKKLHETYLDYEDDRKSKSPAPKYCDQEIFNPAQKIQI